MFHPNPVLNPVSYTLFKSLPLIIMAVLIFNMVQRILNPVWGEKRTATLSLAGILIGLIAGAVLIMRFRLSDLLLIPIAIGLITIIIIKRKTFFPFKHRCIQCNNPLSIRRIVSNNENLCADCENNGEA